jgi:hypothetical protein
MGLFQLPDRISVKNVIRRTESCVKQLKKDPVFQRGSFQEGGRETTLLRAASLEEIVSFLVYV